LLARSVGVDDAERVFVSGLLHDVGRLVMLRNFPEQTAAVLAKAHADLESLHKTERNAWGFSHATLAGMLFKAWRLPLQLLQNVALHHAPSRADDPKEASILHVADIMAHSMLLGASGTPIAPKLNPQAWRRLEVSPRAVEHLSRVVDGYVEDLERVFFSDDD
jgi:HD-like signal output (HDOD) protein